MEERTTCPRSGDLDWQSLLWHAAGGLGPEESRSLAAHLQDCPSCREEVRELQSLGESLRRHATSAVNHPAIEALLAFEAGEPGRESAEARSILAHLEECLSCREELRGLERARERFQALRPGPGGQDLDAGPAAAAARAAGGKTRLARVIGRPAAAWAAVGIAACLATLAALFPLVRDSREISLVAADATFLPEQRGPGEEPVLEGDGPWSIVVELPFGAADGVYRARIEALPAPAPIVAEGHGGKLTLQLPTLPRGRYRLLLEPGTPGGGVPHEYRFRVGRETEKQPER